MNWQDWVIFVLAVSGNLPHLRWVLPLVHRLTAPGGQAPPPGA